MDWCGSGGRSELAIDKKERIWARVSRKQKISILVLSSAMGSNLREILDNVSYPEIFLSFPNAKEKKRIESKEKAILDGCPGIEKEGRFQRRKAMGRYFSVIHGSPIGKPYPSSVASLRSLDFSNLAN
uniref:RNA polymerase Rpb2 domain-containing protein n=1 Tax=Triticum urartu TaxID=4572 RepID=A0A8R7NYC4_TRIUA